MAKKTIKKKKTIKRKSKGEEANIPCKNTDCKLRKQGCKGFAACPGFK